MLPVDVFASKENEERVIGRETVRLVHQGSRQYFAVTRPQGSVQNRPYGVTSKPVNERLYIVSVTAILQ